MSRKIFTDEAVADMSAKLASGVTIEDVARLYSTTPGSMRTRFSARRISVADLTRLGDIKCGRAPKMTGPQPLASKKNGHTNGRALPKTKSNAILAQAKKRTKLRTFVWDETFAALSVRAKAFGLSPCAYAACLLNTIVREISLTGIEDGGFDPGTQSYPT